jgi:hypothetical protein
MPNAQQRGNKDTKSPDEICRSDFSSSSMVTGQVAWWCVGGERRPKPCIFPGHKVLLVREMIDKSDARLFIRVCVTLGRFLWF